MKYSVNPVELSSFFAVPSSVSDTHIKLASEFQIKVLLIFLRNSAQDNYIDIICKKLSLNDNEVIECLDYWVQRGLLLSDKIKNDFNAKKEIEVHESTSKPSRAEAIKRVAKCEELKYLMQVAQEKLSRPITQSEITTFVWIYDQYGLPIPVIIMAIEYAVNKGNTSFSYIEKVCIDWANKDIKSLVQAEEKIKELYLSQTAWKLVESAFGISSRRASVREEKYADKWVNKFGFNKSMLICAYNICVDNIKKVDYKYINTILESWNKKGFKKPEDIENDKSVIKDNSKKSVDTSYDTKKIYNKFNSFD